MRKVLTCCGISRYIPVGGGRYGRVLNNVATGYGWNPNAECLRACLAYLFQNAGDYFSTYFSNFGRYTKGNYYYICVHIYIYINSYYVPDYCFTNVNLYTFTLYCFIYVNFKAIHFIVF